MNPNRPDLRVTDPRFWRTGAAALRWARRLSLLAIVLAALLVAGTAGIAALGGRSAGPVSGQAGSVAWPAALIVAASAVLSRMERTFRSYAEACSQ